MDTGQTPVQLPYPPIKRGHITPWWDANPAIRFITMESTTGGKNGRRGMDPRLVKEPSTYLAYDPSRSAPMNDEARVRQLLDELMASAATPEELCADDPQLLPAVRRRWAICRRRSGRP